MASPDQTSSTESTSAAESAAGAASGGFVGVEGSAASQLALMFAAREAQLHEGCCRSSAPTTWTLRASATRAASPGGWDFGALEDGMHQAAEALVRGRPKPSPPRWPGPRCRCGPWWGAGGPATWPLKASTGAALLVAGPAERERSPG